MVGFVEFGKEIKDWAKIGDQATAFVPIAGDVAAAIVYEVGVVVKATGHLMNGDSHEATRAFVAGTAGAAVVALPFADDLRTVTAGGLDLTEIVETKVANAYDNAYQPSTKSTVDNLAADTLTSSHLERMRDFLNVPDEQRGPRAANSDTQSAIQALLAKVNFDAGSLKYCAGSEHAADASVVLAARLIPPKHEERRQAIPTANFIL